MVSSLWPESEALIGGNECGSETYPEASSPKKESIRFLARLAMREETGWCSRNRT